VAPRTSAESRLTRFADNAASFPSCSARSGRGTDGGPQAAIIDRTVEKVRCAGADHVDGNTDLVSMAENDYRQIATRRSDEIKRGHVLQLKVHDDDTRVTASAGVREEVPAPIKSDYRLDMTGERAHDPAPLGRTRPDQINGRFCATRHIRSMRPDAAFAVSAQVRMSRR